MQDEALWRGCCMQVWKESWMVQLLSQRNLGYREVGCPPNGAKRHRPLMLVSLCPLVVLKRVPYPVRRFLRAGV